ncbi:exocyst complex component sec3A [Perilla frutescens var. hirtella]|uniref:Exocyst complex component sec3A n=1 Tax=Perilla frutescens var. hirtella TaxID=608512 RepID=A0AAD4J4M4_PERFH|nr:exocyst complex component sec3A [Perilla frutescens var. hirtella]KAH6827102.1 exocyst complex component sec3A [Perilla frutescens var. hirtella]
MAKSSADDEELRRACEAAIEGTKQKVVMSMRVAKCTGMWNKAGKLGRGSMAKPRVLAVSTKTKGKRSKAFLRVMKYSSGGVLEPAKLYKLKHLSKVEVVSNDPSGCTFILGFDNLRNHSVAPPQWMMRNIDDRDSLAHIPKVVGIDIVELALWAKQNTQAIPKQQGQKQLQDGLDSSILTEDDMQVTVERELVSQAEEEDMEALLGTYVMGIGEAEAFSERLKRELQALEAANVHAIMENESLIHEVLQGLEVASNVVEDMDEWLSIFNVKLRHMREDIESIETGNNRLEMQSVNNKSLVEELDKLLEKLRMPSEYAACLIGGSFDEASMFDNMESCEWLASALWSLEVPNLDVCFTKMRAVREKCAELENLKSTYARRACEFLKNYFTGLVDFMLNDKMYFSQVGQLKKPDHADLRYKCRTYARLLQHLKSLDKNFLGPLRRAYCSSMNMLLKREAREFATELRASAILPRTPIVWLDASLGSNQSANNADTSTISEVYTLMLTVFIPVLIDEEEFCGLIDWAHKIDPLRCISMHGTTERYISDKKVDQSGFVRIILDDLESRISMLFSRFVDEACHQIERNEKNLRQVGVLSYIPRFAALATRMEQYIQGQSRDLVDQAYAKLVTIMFVTLDKIAQADTKYADVMLLENYAAFQNSVYDLANVVPTLAKFYHQASEAYEQACTRFITTIIYYHFERLFLFARKIEDLSGTINTEEIPFQLGVSKSDLRKVIKSSLSGVDKSIAAMYKKMQKNLTSSEELLPSLWDKCKTEFLDKYTVFAQLVTKVYPAENIPGVQEMRDLLASM